MSPHDKRRVERALSRKGFRRDPDRQDHKYLVYWHEGRPTDILTKVSHSPKHKVIGDQLAALMARQLHLTRRQFDDLVVCTMSGEQYAEKLRERGLLEPR